MKHRRAARHAAEHGAGLHDDDWPGCMVSGHIKVNRVPGNFHIEAASKSHTFNGVSVCCMWLGGGVLNVFCAKSSIKSLKQLLKIYSPLPLQKPLFPWKTTLKIIPQAMTNLSHVVHHLSFGEDPPRRTKKRINRLSEELRQGAPLDGNAYIAHEYHQAPHHFVKVWSW